MLSYRIVPNSLLLACLLSLVLASLAHAAAPATVTVRVEGTNQTLLPLTTVTTNGVSVEKDGNREHTCSGGSAANALELATSGNWDGAWSELFHGYSVETLLGETLAFDSKLPANYFWEYWLDGKPSSVGVCEGELSSGESILFFPECFSEVGACPVAPNPLGISAPAVAERGAPIAVSVTSFANASGAPSPAAGVMVSGGGATATTDASGQATLSLSQTGDVVLQASAPGTVRDEATVCVHNGNDGNCGTQAPVAVVAPAVPAPPPAVAYRGPYALVARATDVLDGYVYPRGRAPRILSGVVASHSPVTSISLRLRRRYRGRCYAYDGAIERFVRVRCGAGSFFRVSSTASFSYLLPSSLAPGRYVLDLQATDAAGNSTSLARGSSRVVFYVR
ncbi:MAG TPA: carboxypeptidase-like regulatory domain-containing protein [Solirubrobacteraceae bacterium]|jgi:hypothetical protein|nr:carboxypeptidase-like regulatory domain-containing protein [Solirubrobacteraceae bacterium]